jgi:hypothetical protein
MAQAHTWFATSDDLPLILNWLCEAGATLADSSVPITELHSDGSERVLYFPSLGPIEYWPASISLTDYTNNSPQWRDAVLPRIRQEEEPQLRLVNPAKTPSAGLKLPSLRDGNYWVSGCLWFPTSNLKTTFPELHKTCQRFERWVRKFPAVFDNRKGESSTKYHNQLGHSGLVHCINALPGALKLLDEGAYMLDYMTSPKCCADFISRWTMPRSE